MAIIVVCGSGRGVGKTALVCGLIAAMPELRWTACKITSHPHGNAQPIFEEPIYSIDIRQGTDTARYRAAGAARALLIAAADDELELVLSQHLSETIATANVIFESNRILRHLNPDLCLAVASNFGQPAKPSFALAIERMDALVARADCDQVTGRDTPSFQLAALDRLSPAMLAWIRPRLAPASPPTHAPAANP
jgi:hypothetical protein